MVSTKQQIKDLVASNKALADALAAQGKKIDDLTPVDFNKLYEEFKAKQGEPPTPICGPHSHYDGTKCVCDPGYHVDPNGDCVPDEGPPPPPPPPPPTTGLLYDSNNDIDWGTQKVTVNKDGNISANGKGFFTAASGSPRVEKDPATKTLRLITQPGFGRFYLCVNNFNGQLDFDFNIESSSVDNMSIKARSRHQSGD